MTMLLVAKQSQIVKKKKKTKFFNERKFGRRSQGVEWMEKTGSHVKYDWEPFERYVVKSSCGAQLKLSFS